MKLRLLGLGAKARLNRGDFREKPLSLGIQPGEDGRSFPHKTTIPLVEAVRSGLAVGISEREQLVFLFLLLAGGDVGVLFFLLFTAARGRGVSRLGAGRFGIAGVGGRLVLRP